MLGGIVVGADRLSPGSVSWRGTCLDVEGGGSADGTRLILHTCHGGAAQQRATPVRPTP